MVTVPQYRDRVAPVSAEKIPSVQQSTAVPNFNSGTNVENASARLNNFAQNIILKEKKNADDIALNDAYNKTVETKNRYLNNPETGVPSMKGKDAAAALDVFGPKFQADLDEVEAGLVNEDQIMAFRNSRAKATQDFNDSVNRYTYVETKRYDQQVYESGINNSINDAILNLHNPQVVSDSIDTQKEMIRNYSERNGLPEETIREETEKAVSKTHTGVIDRMLTIDMSPQAKVYFDQHKDELRADDRVSIEKKLESATLKGASQKLSDEIFSKSNNLTNARMLVKEIEDPELRDAVDDRIVREFALQEKATKAAEDTQYLVSYNILAETKDINKIPNFDSLPPNQQEALKRIEKRLLTGDPINTDNKVYLKYLGMKDVELAKVTEAELLSQVEPYLEKSDFDRIATRWKNAREGLKGSKKADAQFKSFMNDDEMILNGLKNANVLKANEQLKGPNGILNKPAKAEMYRQFEQQVLDKYQAFFNDTGKNPTPQEKQTIINKLLLNKVFVDKTWPVSDVEKPVIFLKESERKNAYIPITKIPNQAKTELINIARSNGTIPPNLTDEQASRLLKNKLERAWGARVSGSPIEAIKKIMIED